MAVPQALEALANQRPELGSCSEDRTVRTWDLHLFRSWPMGKSDQGLHVALRILGRALSPWRWAGHIRICRSSATCFAKSLGGSAPLGRTRAFPPPATALASRTRAYGPVPTSHSPGTNTVGPRSFPSSTSASPGSSTPSRFSRRARSGCVCAKQLTPPWLRISLLALDCSCAGLCASFCHPLVALLSC